MPYRRYELESMAKASESNFWYYAYLAYQSINTALALLSFALLVKVHRSNFNLIDIIVGIHGTIMSKSKPAVICYSFAVIFGPYTISLYRGHTPFNTFGSVVMYIVFLCFLLLSVLPLQSLNPLSPLWKVITQPIALILIAVPAIHLLLEALPPIDQNAARIARAEEGTYLVRHDSGVFVSYHPPYGTHAMGRLQDDIMYLQRLQRQEEERRMAMEYERRARIFDDMERRGVQFASYTYFA
ncbi:hypothetical protein MBANPS3_009842 [Mucor bainieri]